MARTGFFGVALEIRTCEHAYIDLALVCHALGLAWNSIFFGGQVPPAAGFTVRTSGLGRKGAL